MIEPSPPPDRASSRAAIVDLVFQNRGRGSRRRLVSVVVATALLYGGIGIAVWTLKPGPGLHDRVAALIPTQPVVQTVVDLPPPPPPPVRTERVTLPPRVAHVPSSVARVTARSAPRSRPVAPAQAGPVVTFPEPNEPVDLTGETFATGEAASFGGGATAGAAKSAPVVSGTTNLDGQHARTATTGEASRARPVTLGHDTWACPWPAEADAEQIDEQTVVLRARVATTGAAEAVTIVSDPGHGFGRAALECARRTRFDPARDTRGTPMAAWSPPIRVHFRR